VTSRSTLESALANVERQFADAEHVPVPPHWGGWRVRPQSVEFWQGRPNRMHDRLVFELADADWKVRRLAP
jgi:pyridoxamine 5'-phosphate oxidase